MKKCPLKKYASSIILRKTVEILLGVLLFLLFPVILFKISSIIYKISNRFCPCCKVRR